MQLSYLRSVGDKRRMTCGASHVLGASKGFKDLIRDDLDGDVGLWKLSSCVSCETHFWVRADLNLGEDSMIRMIVVRAPVKCRWFQSFGEPSQLSG